MSVNGTATPGDARIRVVAAYVWNSEHDAQCFLSTPHPMLQGRSPLDAAMTKDGARQVEELLWQLYHGVSG
jgi:putative toxin-antitoxin system antitoxin component (TIGR02293 family)